MRKEFKVSFLMTMFLAVIVIPVSANQSEVKKNTLNFKGVVEAAEFYKRNQVIFKDPEMMERYLRIVRTMNKKSK